jgi:hypothetical protein
LGAICAAAVALALASAGSVSAAPTWLSANDLSGVSPFAQEPSVAVDSEGEAVAVWQQVGGALLEASVHPPDQSWQPPVQVASSASGSDQVAFDAHGDATVVWLDISGAVKSATLAAGATTWTNPVTISPTSVGSPALAVNSRGGAVAVWTVSVDDQTTIVQAAFRPAGASAWQTPIQLSTVPGGMMPPSNIVSVPRVALDPQGDAVAVWVQTLATSPSIVAATRPGVSGVWQSPAQIGSTGPTDGGPQVVIDPAGRATAIWADASGIRTADQPLGGTWSTPAAVPGSAGAFDPSLALDPQGDATAVFDQSVGNGVGPSAKADAAASARPLGATWQTPVVISTQNPDSGHAPNPQVAVDPQGDAIAVWTAFDGTNNTAEAANRPAGGAWPAPAAAKTLSRDAEGLSPPQLAVDPQGNAAVVWSLFDGSTQSIQAAGYDGAGPLLSGLSIPAQAVAGTPVAFSVTPVDAWSPVSSTSWGFGDGQSGSGETLTHTYATPGSYKVTVTSTDGLGNPNTTTGMITIAPHTSTAPPPSAPKLSQVSQSHRKWREGSQPATIAREHKSKRPPVGTSFSFKVNEAAQVTLTFTEATSGRRTRGKCRAPSKHNGTHPSCKRTVTRATLGYSVRAGDHTIKFQGQAGKTKIPLGAYTLKLTATNATQQHSRTAALKFTIVK